MDAITIIALGIVLGQFCIVLVLVYVARAFNACAEALAKTNRSNELLCRAIVTQRPQPTSH